eukprot:SAG11_NODE_26129_length_349_cov_1.028000_1_plen_35_part_01
MQHQQLVLQLKVPLRLLLMLHAAIVLHDAVATLAC